MQEDSRHLLHKVRKNSAWEEGSHIPRLVSGIAGNAAFACRIFALLLRKRGMPGFRGLRSASFVSCGRMLETSITADRRLHVSWIADAIHFRIAAAKFVSNPYSSEAVTQLNPIISNTLS